MHQLDWDHLLRPLWGQVSRLEKQAYAAWQAVEERAKLFKAATTPKRLQQHLTQWEQLNQVAAEKVAQFDAFARLAQQVDKWFVLIDLHMGQLREVSEGIKQLQSLGQQLQSWSGRIYQKLGARVVQLSTRFGRGPRPLAGSSRGYGDHRPGSAMAN